MVTSKGESKSRFDRKVYGRHRSKPIPCHFLKLPPNYSYVNNYGRWFISKRPGRRYKYEADAKDNKTLVDHVKVLSKEESAAFEQPPLPKHFKENVDSSLWSYYGLKVEVKEEAVESAESKEDDVALVDNDFHLNYILSVLMSL